MNAFEQGLSQYFTETQLQKIRAVKVGIAGAGGLGSNCAMCLVRSGFTKLKIVDFDKIEPSNLNRQFYFVDQIGRTKTETLKENLQRINPDIEIEELAVKIDRGNVINIFSDSDIVVEAFDKADLKSMIIEELAGTGKFIVSASGLAGYGGSDDIKINKINERLFIIGDMLSDVCDSSPLAPRVNVAAAKQADVILEHVLEGTLG